MNISVEINGAVYVIDRAAPIDISIPLRFNGVQPNAYGVDHATSVPCSSGELVGDTRRGGSCNFEKYYFIPHCNGTHTECVGHITHERISVRDSLQDVFAIADLISVEPETEGSDMVISLEGVKSAIPDASPTGKTACDGMALIVRTLPNDDSKLSRAYDSELVPPYLSAEAMDHIVELGYRHLLVDVPSIDRLFDDGKLSNHRKFWNVEPGSFEITNDSNTGNTITELIYVPNEVADGEYLLNLQIAPFHSDASPSRPVLFKITG